MSALCSLLLPACSPPNTSPAATTADSAANLFPLGQIVATRNALDCLQDTPQLITTLLNRHQSGDWGNLHEEDVRSNQEAIHLCGQLISSYEVSPGGQIVWIITEADRSVTTLLLPDDY